jgi:hypothetical protein
MVTAGHTKPRGVSTAMIAPEKTVFPDFSDPIPILPSIARKRPCPIDRRAYPSDMPQGSRRRFPPPPTEFDLGLDQSGQ